MPPIDDESQNTPAKGAAPAPKPEPKSAPKPEPKPKSEPKPKPDKGSDEEKDEKKPKPSKSDKKDKKDEKDEKEANDLAQQLIQLVKQINEMLYGKDQAEKFADKMSQAWEKMQSQFSKVKGDAPEEKEGKSKKDAPESEAAAKPDAGSPEVSDQITLESPADSTADGPAESALPPSDDAESAEAGAVTQVAASEPEPEPDNDAGPSGP